MKKISKNMKDLEKQFIYKQISPQTFEKLIAEILTNETGYDNFKTHWNYDMGKDVNISGPNNSSHQCKSVQGNEEKFISKLKKLKPKNFNEVNHLYVNINLTQYTMKIIRKNGFKYIYDLEWLLSKIVKYELTHYLPNIKKLLDSIIDKKTFKKALLFFDNDLMNTIYDKKYFGSYHKFNEFYNKFKISNTTLIIGEEGSGKTWTTIHIMNLYCLERDFLPLISKAPKNFEEVLNNLFEIKRYSKRKILLIIDDFIGPFLKESRLDENNIRQFEKLMNFCKEKGIKVILNSRSELIETLKKTYVFEDQEIERAFIGEIEIHEINLKNMDHLSRATILRNIVLRFDKREMFNDNEIIDVVKHSNFKPRILETWCKGGNELNLSKVLDDPDMLYRVIFNQILSKKDKIVLEIIWKLSKYIENITEKLLVSELLKLVYFGSKREINQTIQRLLDLLIERFFNFKKEFIILFANPKIQELLNKYSYNLSDEKFSELIKFYKFDEIDFLDKIDKFKIDKKVLNLDWNLIKIIFRKNKMTQEIKNEYIQRWLKEEKNDININVDLENVMEIMINQNILNKNILVNNIGIENKIRDYVIDKIRDEGNFYDNIYDHLNDCVNEYYVKKQSQFYFNKYIEDNFLSKFEEIENKFDFTLKEWKELIWFDYLEEGIIFDNIWEDEVEELRNEKKTKTEVLHEINIPSKNDKIEKFSDEQILKEFWK